MNYAIDNLLDEDRCYGHLVEHFHGGKLACTNCGSSNKQVHHRRRKPVFQFMCLDCKTYFNVFTGTAFAGTRWPCSKVVMILRGFLKGDSTLSMSREMGPGYRNLYFIHLYIAMFEWMHNLKKVSSTVIQALVFSPKGI